MTRPGGGCCGAVRLTPDDLAHAIGYSEQELATTPDGADLGLSCGNPTAITSLRPGEVVLDLGSGGGSAGMHTVLAGIALPNDASVALHEKMGITKGAHLEEVGFKLGRWVDVGYRKRML